MARRLTHRLIPHPLLTILLIALGISAIGGLLVGMSALSRPPARVLRDG